MQQNEKSQRAAVGKYSTIWPELNVVARSKSTEAGTLKKQRSYCYTFVVLSVISRLVELTKPVGWHAYWRSHFHPWNCYLIFALQLVFAFNLEIIEMIHMLVETNVCSRIWFYPVKYTVLVYLQGWNWAFTRTQNVLGSVWKGDSKLMKFICSCVFLPFKGSTVTS